MISFKDYYGNEIYIHRADIVYIQKSWANDFGIIFVSHNDKITISIETYDLIKRTLKEYYEN
ncbi:MAG: hypothetical protein J6S85_15375 [Methanobrevibacter sp.]|nr:hypothetical protein [Methanobrevibacter sp.]